MRRCFKAHSAPGVQAARRPGKAMAMAPAAGTALMSELLPPGPPSRQRLLVVDDNRDAAESMSMLLCNLLARELAVP